MPDTRPFCIPCSIRMRCRKNGAHLVHPNDFAQAADLYQCPTCHAQILTGYGKPILAIGADEQYFNQFSQQGKKQWVFFEPTDEPPKDMMRPWEIQTPSTLAHIAHTAISALLNDLQNPTCEFRPQLALAVGSIAQKWKEMISVLTQALADVDEAVCFAAVDVFAKLGQPALPTLIKALQSTNDEVRFYALLALDMMGEPAKATIPNIVQTLRNEENEGVRILASEILESLRTPAAKNPARQDETRTATGTKEE